MIRKLPEPVGRSEGSATIDISDQENKTLNENRKYTSIIVFVFHVIRIKTNMFMQSFIKTVLATEKIYKW